jgi:aminomethyltransferase
MKQTSLFEQHELLGAKMVDFAGWMMPIQYQNLKEEVLAVREDVGVFDVSHMGEFFIQGKDAIKAVDYLVTNDISSAQIGKAIYSPLCRENGTIIDDLIVYKISSDKVMICVNAANIDKDKEWITTQLKKFDVTFKDLSQNYSLLAVQGPKTYSTLKNIDLGANLDDIDYYSLQIENSDSETPIIFARTGYTGEDGFEIFGPHEYIQKVWQQLIEKNVKPCGLGARDVLRLEVCYPLYGNELNDEITPLDAGLKWTTKFSKESFIGKEALTNYTPKYQLIKLYLEKGIARAGYAIENSQGETLGIVTSGTMSVVKSQGIALARVKKGSFTDEDIFVNIRNKQFKAIRTKQPFVTGGHK